MERYLKLLDYGVFAILGILSVIAVWASIERLLFYRTIRVDSYTHRKELEIDLTKRLTIITTIGSNAPYVGLLGTIFGIMLTFYRIGENNPVDSAKIMQGLALALIATALGLCVAIPAVIFYNLLVRKSEVLLAKWDIYQDLNTQESSAHEAESTQDVHDTKED
ncbi:MAG: TonB-system energizer ExbB [Wolinella sp.]